MFTAAGELARRGAIVGTMRPRWLVPVALAQLLAAGCGDVGGRRDAPASPSSAESAGSSNAGSESASAAPPPAATLAPFDAAILPVAPGAGPLVRFVRIPG
jgi:hypothetical protein